MVLFAGQFSYRRPGESVPLSNSSMTLANWRFMGSLRRFTLLAKLPVGCSNALTCGVGALNLSHRVPQ